MTLPPWVYVAHSTFLHTFLPILRRGPECSPLNSLAYLFTDHDLAALGVDDDAAQALGDGHGLKGAGGKGQRGGVGWSVT